METEQFAARRTASSLDFPIEKGAWVTGTRLQNLPLSQPMNLRAFRCLRLVLCFVAALALVSAQAQAPASETEVVHYSKLLPLLPEAPEGWTAEEAEGSTDDSGGFNLTTVHRDYRKGEGDNVPITSMSILDTAGNAEYASATTASWGEAATESAEGYSKPTKVEGYPAFESFEKETKHGTLYVFVADRFLLQIETQGQEAAELQEWLKRIDLKKLAEVK